MKRAQTKKWLDLVDETGYGLIHYAIILGFDTALPILIDYDCNLSLQSKNGITPIDLALALHQEVTILKFILKRYVNMYLVFYKNNNRKQLDC